MTEPKKWRQSTVFGVKLEIPEKRDLDKVCCASCYYAEEPVCNCKCHGAYHGLGRLNKRTKRDSEKTESKQGEAAGDV